MKVKLFFSTEQYCDECCHNLLSNHVTETEWDEISDKDWYDLVSAIGHFNKTHQKSYTDRQKVIAIRKLEEYEEKDINPKLIASEWLKHQQKLREKEENEKINRTLKANEAKRKRDLKKLQKLQKEYGKLSE